MESKIVVITGATGFLGSHVVEHFLNAGYRVKALCRISKADELKTRSDDPKLSVEVIDNLATDDFTSILKGVHAVVHVASPTPFYTNHIEVAVKGTLNILTQAYALGIRKFVCISSIYSIISKYEDLQDLSRVFDHNSWGSVPECLRTESAKYTKEFFPPKDDKPLTVSSLRQHRRESSFDRLFTMSKHLLYSLFFRRSASTGKLGEMPNSHNTDLHNATRSTQADKNHNHIPSAEEEPPKETDPFVLYAASKLLAEEAVWLFADAHSDVDMITILPAYFYGPISKFQIIRETTTLSTNYILYSLFARPQAAYPPELIPDHVVDVRDVAKCCVLAVSTPKPESRTIPRRRILLCSGVFSWKDVATEIATYPEVKDRVVVDQKDAKSVQRPAARVDVSMAHQVLGWNEFTPWKTFVKDAVSCLLKTEKQWNPQA